MSAPDLTVHERRIGVRLRTDLQVSHQKRDGIDRAVIKDPLTHRFYDLAWDDHQLALRIQPGATAREIVETWQKALPGFCRGRDAAELESRADRLCTAIRRLGLAESSGTGLRGVAQAQTWGGWIMRWMRRISAPMFMRFRLFDPDELLGELVERWRPIFSMPALFLACAFIGVSALGCLTHISEMAFHPEWFGVWQNLVALYFGILVLKVVHESGHALVCKALGGHVHEVGVQLLALHPTFFVDVSDTWMWPDRRRRIAVAAAGFGAEMLVAGALFWMWRLLAPGFARDLCLNLMFIASVSAVLFNANPLMRYDGYHMLADFLREPQLRQKAFGTISQTIRRWIFGRRLVAAVPRKKKLIFALYGILSSAYLVWIAFVVVGFLRKILAPFGLEAVGQVILAAWLLSMFLPILGFLGGIARDTFRIERKARWRPLAIGAALAAAAVMIVFVPIPIRVERDCVIDVSAAGVVRASQAGLFAEILVREGATVRKGQPIARLRNPSLALANTKAAIDVELARSGMLASVGANRPEQVQLSLRRFNEATANALQAAHRVAELEILSPCDGTVLTRRLERKVGQMVRPGEVVMSIAERDRRECLVPLDEKEARRVKEGAAVTFRTRAHPRAEFSGKISAAPLRIKADDLPRALTAVAGGGIAVDAAGRVSSSEVTHVSRFQIDATDSRALPGLTGRVRLDCGYMPVGEWLVEKFRDVIHLDHGT